MTIPVEDIFQMKKPKSMDFFAEVVLGRELKVPGESDILHRPAIEEQTLEFTADAGSPYPERVPRMRNREDLEKRIRELRKAYAPYLEDRVPEDAISCLDEQERIDLREFEFKYLETETIRPDTLTEDTEGWEQVFIPDLRGPLGRWTGVYRRSFPIPERFLQEDRVLLHFEAVDYHCEVYLNGMYVGSHTGFFAPFHLDVKDAAKAGENTLLIKVQNEIDMLGEAGDKIYGGTGFGWDKQSTGWVHCPAGAGISGDIFVTTRRFVSIERLFVDPEIDPPCMNLQIDVENLNPPREESLPVNTGPARSICRRARPKLDFRVDLYKKNAEGVGAGKLASYTLNGPLACSGENTFRFRIKVDDLDIKLWHFDSPHLYTAVVACIDKESGEIYSRKRLDFGFRTFEAREETMPRQQYFLNNERVYLRGANTMGHMQWAAALKDYDRLIEDILIAKAANMNFYRMTQRPVHSAIYKHFDMLGMGCQSDFPGFANFSRSMVPEILKQTREMVLLTRSHPSVLVESFMNEPAGTGWREAREIEAKVCDTKELNHVLEAMRHVVEVYNPSRVLMCMDGFIVFGYGDESQLPFGIQCTHYYSMWYGSHQAEIGPLYAGQLSYLNPEISAACGEYGAEALDSIEVMQKGRQWHLEYPREFIPEGENDSEWTPDRIPKNQQIKGHMNWYRTGKTAGEWVAFSQAHQAFAARLMTESLRLRMDMIQSTAIHLLIDAFPAGWMKALVSFDRTPKPGYFEFADALAPVSVIIKSDRIHHNSGQALEAELWICNDKPDGFDQWQLEYYLLDEERKGVLCSGQTVARIEPSMANYQGTLRAKLPEVSAIRSYILFARLFNEAGEAVHGHEFRIKVFPPLHVNGKACFLSADPSNETLLEYSQAGLGIEHQKSTENFSGYQALIVPDQQTLIRNEAQIIAFVERGGTAFLLSRNTAYEWSIPSRSIEISIFENRFRKDGLFGGRDGLDFAVPDGAHPLAAEFTETDFCYWYRAGIGRRDYISNTLVFTQTPCEPVLRSGEQIIVCSIPLGKGKIIVNELILSGRLAEHPVVRRMLVSSLFA
jgi:hypothetical protein